MTSGNTFKTLHDGDALLLLPNAWDAGSARLIENLGAKAIATTSAGLAWSRGYPDGDALPIEQLLAAVRDIARVIRVPLTVDIEAGYSDDPAAVAELATRIIDAGAVGINIEDGEGTSDLLAKKIEKARKAAESAGVNVFINARTDVFLAEIGSPESRIGETIKRAARYQGAGANGIFVPGLSETDAIKAIASEVKMPLNVMSVPDLPSAKELKKLGVRRLSAGTAIAQAVWGRVAELAASFLASGDSKPFYKTTMPYGKLQELFKR